MNKSNIYKITSEYDSNADTRQVFIFNDPLEAFRSYEKFTDWGFANEYSTVNLFTPEGRTYSKTLFRPNFNETQIAKK